jgi:hypothetical protein
VAAVLWLAGALCAAETTGTLAQQRPAHGAAWPLYSHLESLDGTDRDTWVLWPFVESRDTPTSTTFAIHPLFSATRNLDSGQQEVDILWPFVTARHKPRTRFGARENTLRIFPVLFARRQQTGRVTDWSQMLFPVYYNGKQGRTGRYLVVAPFFWYARDAKLAVPLFPRRPQTFAALWPLMGDFRGYYNRDRIQFILWPLYVRSRDGVGDDRNVYTSFAWPITGIVSGPKTWGFRLWPLVSYVEREDKFRRAYWLWPLGGYRRGVSSKTGDTTQSLTYFAPFYFDMDTPKFRFKAVFPFYGRLETKGRKTRGWALAIYSEDDDLRRGFREHRILWFLIRWRTRIPTTLVDQATADERARTGGGVFPFYFTRNAQDMKRRTVLWPLYHEKWDHYPAIRDERTGETVKMGYEYRRRYIAPFFSDQVKTMDDGSSARSTFVFPFFRRIRTMKGTVATSSLHLWFYDQEPAVDRNWSALWTFHERTVDHRTGARKVRVAKGLYTFERSAEGEEKSRVNLLFLDVQDRRGGNGPDARSIDAFWGLYGRKRVGDDVRRRILWIPY